MTLSFAAQKASLRCLAGALLVFSKTLNSISLNSDSALFGVAQLGPAARYHELTNTLPKKSQLAYIHKIDKTLFMHGGLANLFVQLRVAPQNRKNVLAAVKAINQMSCETMWATDSPIWYRPQLSPNQNAKRLYRGGEYLQVVGHTPVKEVYLEGGVLSCDTFSTYRDGTPYGSQSFCIVDTVTWEFETVKVA